MTKVTIVAEDPGARDTAFRASARDRESVGPTAGAALDALTAQLPADAGTLIVVQNLRPDQFFSADQQRRLQYLFEKWRTARDAGQALTPDEQAELDTLSEAELNAAALRA